MLPVRRKALVVAIWEAIIERLWWERRRASE